MAKRRRTWILTAVVLAALIAAAVIVVFGPSLSTNQTLPNPNGFTDFVRAGNLLVGDISRYGDLDHEALRSLVSSNSEPLRLVRLGLTRKCSFPTAVALTNQNWMLGELSHLKYLAQLLRAEGLLAEMEGRPADAAESYLVTIRFGDQASRGGFLINRLVGMACEAIGQNALVKLTPRLGPQKTAAVSKELQRIDEERVNFDEIKRNERLFTRHELFKQGNPVYWIKGVWDLWKMTQKCEIKNKLLVAHERLLATELALRSYQHDYNRSPRRLDELLTNYLSNVPLDPFTGRPVVYRPGATNWLLYSVGQDGIDDGGLPAPRLSVKGDVFFDSP